PRSPARPRGPRTRDPGPAAALHDQVRGSATRRVGRRERVMFERFTDRARRVVVLAQEIARMNNLPNIDDECLLAAVIEEEESLGAKMVANFGVQAVIEPHDGPRLSGHIPLTLEAKRSLEF